LFAGVVNVLAVGAAATGIGPLGGFHTSAFVLLCDAQSLRLLRVERAPGSGHRVGLLERLSFASVERLRHVAGVIDFREAFVTLYSRRKEYARPALIHSCWF